RVFLLPLSAVYFRRITRRRWKSSRVDGCSARVWLGLNHSCCPLCVFLFATIFLLCPPLLVILLVFFWFWFWFWFWPNCDWMRKAIKGWINRTAKGRARLVSNYFNAAGGFG
ncbi:unnamed protein product, partial [Ectocarpus sp. 8 AP-2014]